MLAHGDSWFDYPRILGTGGGLIRHLAALTGWSIENIAHHGDGTELMLGLLKRMELERDLPGTDVLFFSGGGNDIAGDQFCLWLNDNRDGDFTRALALDRLKTKLDAIEQNYLDLIQIRDEHAPGCMIVTHSYDFPIPSDVGVCGLGPWLKPSLDYCGWMNPQEQYNIVKTVMLAFNLRMEKIEADQQLAGRPFIHVNTQGTLGPDDWANEIHPNRAGFEKLAALFKSSLSTSGARLI